MLPPVACIQTPATMLRMSTEFTRETSAVAYVPLQINAVVSFYEMCFFDKSLGRNI